MKKKKAVVVFSGGQDSTTCLFWSMEKFASVIAVSIAYGQKHETELDSAREICEKYHIEHEIIPVSSIKSLGGNALVDKNILIEEAASEKELPSTFVPGRNIIFLSLAAARAYQSEIEDIVTGVGQADYSGYPDCREDFVISLEKTLSLGMQYPIRIHRPLMFKNKAQIWELSDRLGHLQDIVELTHTCYNGNRDHLHSWGYGCGECPACKLRMAGYEQYMEKKDGL